MEADRREELDRIKRAEEIQRYTENRCEALEKENAELKEINADLKQSLDWANEREREDVKRITELEEKISILLSCKNCPENKGGYICEKEYEGKCLSQKTQYIKELQEENAELKDKLSNLASVAGVRLANWQKYEKENAKLKEQNNKAKELIRNIIRVTWGEGWNYDLGWKVKAEQFIKED